MMVPIPPVMEADADLEDPVIQVPDRGAGVPPQGLEGLVLLEEFAGVELLDAADQRIGRRVGAPRARVLVDLTTGDALGWPRRLPLAASGLGRVRRRAAFGSGARRG